MTPNDGACWVRALTFVIDDGVTSIGNEFDGGQERGMKCEIGHKQSWWFIVFSSGLSNYVSTVWEFLSIRSLVFCVSVSVVQSKFMGLINCKIGSCQVNQSIQRVHTVDTS